jgi:hypothetical protein
MRRPREKFIPLTRDGAPEELRGSHVRNIENCLLLLKLREVHDERQAVGFEGATSQLTYKEAPE